MIDRWSIFDRHYETSGISAVGAFRFVWTSFGIENTARVDRHRHRNRHFSVSDLNLATDTHDSVSLGLLAREVCELHQITGQFRITDECCARFPGDLNCIADVIAMPMSEQYVIDFRKRCQRIFSVLYIRVDGLLSQGSISRTFPRGVVIEKAA